MPKQFFAHLHERHACIEGPQFNEREKLRHAMELFRLWQYWDWGLPYAPKEALQICCESPALTAEKAVYTLLYPLLLNPAQLSKVL